MNRIIGLFLVALTGLQLLVVLPANAQVPGIPGLTLGQTESAPAETSPPTTSELEALRRVIDLLGDDAKRTSLLQDLRGLEATLAQTKSSAADATTPAGDATPEGSAEGQAGEGQAGEANAEPVISSDEGLIGAITTTLSETAQSLPSSALGVPMEQKVTEAANELRERAAAAFGGVATVEFFKWAGPGIVLAGVLSILVFRSTWLLRRRTLTDRPKGTPLRNLRKILIKAAFGILPIIGIFATASLWATYFAPSWRDGQLFLAILSSLFGAMLLRQVAFYILLSLGSSRGWRLVGYAQKRILPWIAILAATAAVTGLLREFSIRMVIGRNVADIAALVMDVVLAILTVIFILRHRLTVRSLLLHGRRKHDDGSRASGVLSSAFNILARNWHFVALAFVLANIVARLAGIGSGYFIAESSVAILYLFGGLAALAIANVTFSRMSKNMSRGRTSVQRAILRRYLEIAHILVQIAVVWFVVVSTIDVWGFDLGDRLGSEQGQRFVRPVLSLILIPAVIYALWVTVNTAITHALEPTDSRGRVRQHSGRVKTLLPLIRNLVFVVLSVVAVIAVLANIGVNVTPLLAGAGVIGLAFSFGAQQLVQDVITGFFIIFEDTIAVGDWVSTGDRTGQVEGMTIRTLRLRDGAGALHSIPFGQIKALQNNSRGFGVYAVNVAVAYEADVDQTMKIMNDVGRELLVDPDKGANMLAPLEVWGVDGFTMDGVVIKGAIRCRANQHWGVGREFNRRLKLQLDEAGIRFHAAQRTVRLEEADTHAQSGGANPAGQLIVTNRA